MQDEHQPFTEYAPTWKRIDPANPPKAKKMLFKDDFGGAVIGVWYEGCNWRWYCGLPKHSEADKAEIRARASGTDGRFTDGKSYEGL